MSIRYTTLTSLQEEERDALQELMNLATGKAGDALARVLKAMVHLSVPVVHLIPAHSVNKKLKEVVRIEGPYTAARQGFQGALNGEAITIFDEHGCDELWDLLGYDRKPDEDNTRNEMIMEVSNILVGALLRGIGEQMSSELSFSAPSLLAQGQQIGKLLKNARRNWTYSLLIRIAFQVENREFSSNVVIMFTEQSVDRLRMHAQSLLGE